MLCRSILPTNHSSNRYRSSQSEATASTSYSSPSLNHHQTREWFEPTRPPFVALMTTNQQAYTIELIRRSVTSIAGPRVQTTGKRVGGGERRGRGRGTVRIPLRSKRKDGARGGKGKRGEKKRGTIEYLVGKNSHRKSVPRQRRTEITNSRTGAWSGVDLWQIREFGLATHVSSGITRRVPIMNTYKEEKSPSVPLGAPRCPSVPLGSPRSSSAPLAASLATVRWKEEAREYERRLIWNVKTRLSSRLPFPLFRFGQTPLEPPAAANIPLGRGGGVRVEHRAWHTCIIVYQIIYMCTGARQCVCRMYAHIGRGQVCLAGSDSVCTEYVRGIVRWRPVSQYL